MSTSQQLDMMEEATENTYLMEGDEESPVMGTKKMIAKDNSGVSVWKAALMFTMSIAGAGVLGISGAIAQSGGLASIAAFLMIAYTTKRSYDLLIALSLDTEGVKGSYERLGDIALGTTGRLAVFVAKFMYAFFTLIVHIKVVKDNFPSAMMGILGSSNEYLYLFEDKDVVTFVISFLVVFPLCLLRDFGLVEHTSTAKLATVFAISFIILHMYFTNPGRLPIQGTTVYEDWLAVKPNLLPSLGTFVFFFVGHHCAHLSFDSLRKDIRDIKHWKQVSTLCVLLCIFLGICMGLTVYMTFWSETTSIMLQLYPNTDEINVAKILVCGFAIFTLPLPFLAVREMIVVSIPHSEKVEDCWWLQGETQLIGRYHFALTFIIWFIATMLAILAPSLNDVLNVGGCFSGSLIAYILPSLFYFSLRGYSREACFMMVLGLVVGVMGTFFAVRTMLMHLGMLP
uniref:Amino acid transporter transmembrane domain-containing protein n=1 Tax=Cyclophora tenuis TaxID=216820 RepID=A0A7S1D7Z0_CYCTE|mmetsp:Transcript_3551/g.6049  ORF Transcript_3551/g.6049 Transcript_3551/m.6049 type:complete len:455 (+) Transcript_3551:102-1466(+)